MYIYIYIYIYGLYLYKLYKYSLHIYISIYKIYGIYIRQLIHSLCIDILKLNI